MPVTRSLRSKGGFTLIEVLVAAAITVVLVGILLRITTLTSTTVTQSSQKLSAFASARTAFDIITRTLSQATLNTYLDYYDSSGLRRTQGRATIYTPVAFGRASDLQFLVQANTGESYYGQELYFQAPRAYSGDANLQSVQGLLNACGYYIQFGNGSNYRPTAVTTAGTAPKYRYRLMQGLEPTESFQVFADISASVSSTGKVTDSTSWLSNIKNGSTQGSAYVSPLADNVIALVVWPRLSVNDDSTGYTLLPTSTAYSYDSQASVAPTLQGSTYTQVLTADQLPPDVQVTMVVLDEASAIRVQGTSTTAPSVIESALAGRFQKANSYATDITGLATLLSAAHLNYQIFNTTVALRESKWSSQN